MIRLAVHGARGRMGTRICALAADDGRFEIGAAIPPDAVPRPTDNGPREIDVVIDFSSPDGTMRALDIAVDQGAALLVGTTGLSSGNVRAVDDAGESIAVMIAPNTSLGVTVQMTSSPAS